MSTSLSKLSRLYLYSTILLLPELLLAQTCYLPNGQPDVGQPNSPQPCNLLAKFSHCCSPGATCLSNGYCYDPTSLGIYRSSCTDQTWKSNACPVFCNDVQTNTGSSLYNAQDSKFCCGPTNGSDACAVATHNSFAPFTLTDGFPIFNQTDGSTGPNSTSAGPTVTVTATKLATHMSKAEGNHDEAIGLGVGLPLGILLLAMIGFSVFQSRENRRLKKRIAADVQHRIDGKDTDYYTYTDGKQVAETTKFSGRPEMAGVSGRPDELDGMPRGELPASSH